ncbi:hypothetical protein Tco_1312827 [Tanacetum coccineum]
MADDVERKTADPREREQIKPQSAQVEEIVFEVVDTNMPQNQGDEVGHIGEQPNVEDAPNDLAKARKPPLTFNELMITPIDFSAYAMNQLKISNLTKADLVGPVYNLLKGTCISCVELEYNMEEFYKALTDQLDSKNPKGN